MLIWTVRASCIAGTALTSSLRCRQCWQTEIWTCQLYWLCTTVHNSHFRYVNVTASAKLSSALDKSSVLIPGGSVFCNPKYNAHPIYMGMRCSLSCRLFVLFLSRTSSFYCKLMLSWFTSTLSSSVCNLSLAWLQARPEVKTEPKKEAKAANSTQSDLTSGPPSLKEIVDCLRSWGPVKASELSSRFKKRLPLQEDKKQFTANVKKVSQLVERPPGSGNKFVVLK